MSKYAYVTLLYGNNIYLSGALVLGYSLMKTNTPYDRIIMVTPDVSGDYKFYLKHMYTHVQEIEYIKVNPEIFLEESTRFNNVFTKLECLSLTQYDKIIFLDLDMIIVKNLDHLFNLNAPAACLKKHYIPYGKKIPSSMICSDKNKLIGSINAGVMLLEPNLNELNDIKNDISKITQPNKYKYPEQDYISLRYCNKWTSITFNYNFQFGLTNRVKKCHYAIDNIYVIHYSSSNKPWNYLLENHTITDNEKEFIEKHHKYYLLWKNAYNMIKEKLGNNAIILPY